MKVVIAEPLAPAAIEQFQAQQGWDIVVSNPKEYAAHLSDCDALVVRSAVKVNKAVLEQAPNLRVIGRAGVGVDNVDMTAATAAGVLVMNTPGGNAVSVAEHTLAFMLSMARMVPQASASTKSGKWEKKKFLGNELRSKTLGVVGLGAIGREVVLRARAFEMKIIACDPFITSQTAANLGVELVELDNLYKRSDYISLHVGVTPETRGMINAASIAKMKDGVRIVNCARGELVDQEALLAGLQSGKVGGAALDVFDPEPPAADLPLLAHENVFASPHIGGSTEEAQEIVGIRIAQQMVEYLASGVAINAVNMPALSPEQYKTVGPWLDLAERLGKFVSFIAEGNPKAVHLTYSGSFADSGSNLIRNAGLAGVLGRSLSGKANLVNAMQIAAERGLQVAERRETRYQHLDALVIELETDKGSTAVEGSLVLGKPRLIRVEGIPMEAALAGNLTFLRNEDVPGVIGHVGTILGTNKVNIANFALGRQEAPAKPGAPLEAIAIVETDATPGDNVLAQLSAHAAVLRVRTVILD
ncbi:MAG: phosphoglycerate dehydrogenase [Bryobacterales bacterium]|nr:phosphoglycerate dehydrogenase [Bryobacterales bacterium]